MASYIIIGILSVLAAAHCNDLRAGYQNPRQRLIFEQTVELSPAIWLRAQTVDVKTTGNEVISQIYVEDLRELKDGEAKIVSGGAGSSTATIELKGPAVFRGMSFLVRVYAVDRSYYGDQSGVYNGRVVEAYPTKTGNFRYNQQGQQVSGDYNTYPAKTGGYNYDQQLHQVQ